MNSCSIRLGLLACVVVATSLCATAAHAQGYDEFGAFSGRDDSRRKESPQDFAFELRIGRYLPRIDSEFGGGASPAAQALGTKHRVLVGMELDWQALRFGDLASFGPGFGLGYTLLSRDAKITGTPNYSDVKTNLKILPVWTAGVLRFDLLNRRYGIPLVFTGKLGLGGAAWWATLGDERSIAGDGSKGKGTSYGMMYALGAMLDLAFLEPSRARSTDTNAGVNHMYLMGEWYALELNAFGSGGVMNVGDRTWTLGIAMEF